MTCIEAEDFSLATSGQAAWAAAMCSKDTGGVAAATNLGGDGAEQAPDVAGQAPDVAEGPGNGGGGENGLDRASATTFSTPGVCWMSVENSEM